MKHYTMSAVCTLILLSSSHCETEKEPEFGSLEVSVYYPEVIIGQDSVYWNKIPGVGAEVRLYDKDAVCLGYKDAMLNLVKIGDEYATSEFSLVSNEHGSVVFEDIPVDEYLLIIYARGVSKYTEKQIEISNEDTLILSKTFYPTAQFVEDLEPWDYEMPGY